MTQRPLEVIGLPFFQGLLSFPESGTAFMLRGDAHPSLLSFFRSRLICEQTYKPSYERLRTSGFAVTERLEGFHDFGLCLLTPHRHETYSNIARAWQHLSEDGILVCAGENTLGAASYEKAVSRLSPLAGRLSKAKCRVFWLKRTETNENADGWSAWLSLGTPGRIAEGGFLSVPGLFSWDRIDPGSRLLAQSMPPGIEGIVADLGAGWGFLSHTLLETTHRIARLDLFEAEKLALDMALANLKPKQNACQIAYHWHDVTQGTGRDQYDWIVTNPPFHHSGVQDVTLGIRFIEAASTALRRGGKLLLVANRHLPYEQTIRTLFRTCDTQADNGLYKVLLATK